MLAYDSHASWQYGRCGVWNSLPRSPYFWYCYTNFWTRIAIPTIIGHVMTVRRIAFWIIVLEFGCSASIFRVIMNARKRNIVPIIPSNTPKSANPAIVSKISATLLAIIKCSSTKYFSFLAKTHLISNTKP